MSYLAREVINDTECKASGATKASGCNEYVVEEKIMEKGRSMFNRGHKKMIVMINGVSGINKGRPVKLYKIEFCCLKGKTEITRMVAMLGFL